MRKSGDKKDQILKFVRKSGIVSTGDVSSLGIHHEYLRQLCAEGLLVREDRGRYTLRTSKATPHHGLALAGTGIPRGVICLLSALRFHEIRTQGPREVWIAIDRRAARPRVKHPKIRIVRFSGKALAEGWDIHDIEGVPVRIYSPAKTVADCFKYRNKIGLDVALEALREALRGRECTIDELWRYAGICRVREVMRPYMVVVMGGWS